MSQENEKIVTRLFNECFNKKNPDLIDELVSPSFVMHHPFPGTKPDREGLKNAYEFFRYAFPDINTTIEEIICDKDKVVIRDTVRGTHKGDFVGIPGTGKEIEIQSFNIFRIENGKIAEHWGLMDSLEILKQITFPAVTGFEGEEFTRMMKLHSEYLCYQYRNFFSSML